MFVRSGVNSKSLGPVLPKTIFSTLTWILNNLPFKNAYKEIKIRNPKKVGSLPSEDLYKEIKTRNPQKVGSLGSRYVCGEKACCVVWAGFGFRV